MLIASPDLADKIKRHESLYYAHPAFRLSHCPPTRISNAASPRPGIIYRVSCTEHARHLTLHQKWAFPLPYLSVGSNLRDSNTKDNVRKRLSHK